MVDPILSILGLVAKKVFDKLIDKVIDKGAYELSSKLKGDSARNAFKKALGKAIHSYATTDKRLILARPLLEKNGPLTEDSVAEELMQIVRFEREPNAEMIGNRWKDAIDDPPQWCDFTKEAERLIKYLRIELRGTDVFRPVFDAKSLDAIATSVSPETLGTIEKQLVDLVELMDSRLRELEEVFARASPNIHDHIRDYTRFIEEKTRGFVGRQFVFDEISQFTENNPRGYFFVRGDPGIGKSAIAAYIVKEHGYVHHFNIRAEGINKTETFLWNICAQLITLYELDYNFLPSEVVQDAGFLKHLLGEISDKLSSGEKAIIVIDALDEVDSTGLSEGANTLYLPMTLPQGIYIIATVRKDVPNVKLRIECEQGDLYVKHNSAGNITDIRKYVEGQVENLGIKAYIDRQSIGAAFFVDHMIKKSEGNFMYLHYVLPEIESGAYKDLKLDAIPVGLENYYEDHWKRMGMMAKSLPRIKINIIYIMAEVRSPVSRQFLSELAGVDQLTIQGVLDDWRQFLHKQIVGEQIHYSMYHTSFLEFLHRKDIVQAAGVTIESINAMISNDLWKGLFENE